MERNFEPHRVKLIPVAEVVVNEGRQRSVLKDTGELALSIKKAGLFHPIVVSVKDGKYILVAGERRLRAFELLVTQGDKDYATIPAYLHQDLTPAEAQLIELEENIKRQDLDWKDHAKATLNTIHAYQQAYDDWPVTKICDHIGADYSWICKVLKVAKALMAEHTQVQAASGIKAAYAVLEREAERKKTADIDKLEEVIFNEPEETPAIPLVAKQASPKVSVPAPQGTPTPHSILQGNFELWSDEYSGPKFNFIHCDFPYGIDHQDSAQGGAKTWGAYEDSEDTYWRLCGVLLRNRERLMLRNCHIMFWLSMKYYSQTIEFFNKHAPGEFELTDEYPLAWHKSDNKGILSDHTRRPRRIYETALMFTRGDRKIVQAVGNCISAPTNKSDAIHISEKPVPVLNHFFRMFVDPTTRMLDPTCGGGTSVRAAASLGAEMALGIELDELYAQAAEKKLLQSETLRLASKKIEEAKHG